MGSYLVRRIVWASKAQVAEAFRRAFPGQVKGTQRGVAVSGSKLFSASFTIATPRSGKTHIIGNALGKFTLSCMAVGMLFVVLALVAGIPAFIILAIVCAFGWFPEMIYQLRVLGKLMPFIDQVMMQPRGPAMHPAPGQPMAAQPAIPASPAPLSAMVEAHQQNRKEPRY